MDSQWRYRGAGRGRGGGDNMMTTYRGADNPCRLFLHSLMADNEGIFEIVIIEEVNYN